MNTHKTFTLSGWRRTRSSPSVAVDPSASSSSIPPPLPSSGRPPRPRQELQECLFDHCAKMGPPGPAREEEALRILRPKERRVVHRVRDPQTRRGERDAPYYATRPVKRGTVSETRKETRFQRNLEELDHVWTSVHWVWRLFDLTAGQRGVRESSSAEFVRGAEPVHWVLDAFFDHGRVELPVLGSSAPCRRWSPEEIRRSEVWGSDCWGSLPSTAFRLRGRSSGLRRSHGWEVFAASGQRFGEAAWDLR